VTANHVAPVAAVTNTIGAKHGDGSVTLDSRPDVPHRQHELAQPLRVRAAMEGAARELGMVCVDRAGAPRHSLDSKPDSPNLNDDRPFTSLSRRSHKRGVPAL
jgi:hypothetical protein